MRAYLARVAGFRREIKLFLLFNLFANIGVGVFVLIFNLYLVQLGFQEDFIGIYHAASTVAMGLTALAMGALINRFGSWRCIFFGTWFFLVSSTVLVLISAPALILLLGVFAGVGAAFLFVPVMPFIVEYARGENRSTAAALAFSIISLAMTFGSLIGGWSPRLFATLLELEVVGVAAYRLTLLLGVAVAALGMIPFWVMRDARHRRPSGETGQFSIVTELPIARRRVRKDITVFVLVGVLLSVGSGAVIPFYNVFLQSIGASPSQIGIIFSLAGVVAAVTSLLAPMTARRFGPLTGVLLVRLSPIPFCVLLIIAPQLSIAIMAHIVRTTSISMAWPIESTFIADLLPPEAHATAFGIRSGTWNLGFAASSFVGGQIIVAFGYAPIFAIFAVFSLLSTMMFYRYFQRHPSVAPSLAPLPSTVPASHAE